MITITKSALKRFKEVADSNDFIRIGVVGGGCAGLTYNIEIEERADEDDILIELEGVNICIDRNSSFMLSETTVNYIETMQQSGFRFDNPQAASSCGCGTSFSPKEDPSIDSSIPLAGGCSTGGCPSS